MARDRAMLDEAAESGTVSLRLYRWDPPCLSLGRNQTPLHHEGIDIVRRPTGGGAVWHEHEVTYAVAAPIALFGSLRRAYRSIHETIAAALETLGAGVHLAPDRRSARPAVRPSVCFSDSVGGEILINGRKVVGSAQVRQRGAFLQHGSILLDGTQDIAARLTGDVGRATWDASDTTLRAVLGRRVTFDEVAEAVLQAWGGAMFSASQS
jgi:lipoate-protein ligase A